MATTSSPRSAIHALWTAFVPSAIFLLIYLAIFISIVGTGPFISLQSALVAASAKVSKSDAMALLEQLDLIKLLPFVAVFGIAFLLYVFDRLVLTLGHTMPPRPIWRGSLVAHVPEYLLWSLWQLLAWPKYLRSIEVEVDRLVNIARAAQKEFLLGSLTYGESRFSFAANLFAYGKSALVWSIACVVWAVAPIND